LLPDINADGPSDGVPVWDVDAWRRYRALAHDVEDLQQRTGLRADHVPAWDLQQGEVFAPPEKRRPQRVELAVATHMLLADSVHNKETERRSRTALGITGSGWTTRRLSHGRGIASRADSEIRQLVQSLVDDGLVDYAHRRRHLAEAPGLTHQLRSILQAWSPQAGVPLEAVETWLWVAITRSPPVEGFLFEPAIELDQRMNPEQRLFLHQVVEEYLDNVEPSGPILTKHEHDDGAVEWEASA